MNEVDSLAQIIRDYMNLQDVVASSDCILVFGSRDLSPAHKVCDLFLEGYAKYIIFSGYHSDKQNLTKPEAEKYADIALGRGIPREAIFIENKSCNTGENIILSKELILKENIPHDKIILVHKPYALRRVYSAFKKRWPEPKTFLTSEQISYKDYIKDNLYYTKEEIINIMVGDLRRIKEYPKLGFQIEQDIPNEVWITYEKLVALGYNKGLIK